MFKKKFIIIVNILLILLLLICCFTLIRDLLLSSKVNYNGLKNKYALKIKTSAEVSDMSNNDNILTPNIFFPKALEKVPESFSKPKWTLKGVTEVEGKKIAIIMMPTSRAHRRNKSTTQPNIRKIEKRVEEGDIILEAGIEILELNIDHQYVKYAWNFTGKTLLNDYLYKDKMVKGGR